MATHDDVWFNDLVEIARIDEIRNIANEVERIFAKDALLINGSNGFAIYPYGYTNERYGRREVKSWRGYDVEDLKEYLTGLFVCFKFCAIGRSSEDSHGFPGIAVYPRR